MLKPAPTIKGILLDNHNWWNYYLENQSTIRPSVLESVIKLLSCKRRVRGYMEFRCSNPNCGHAKIVPFTCKSRACTSCGYRQTNGWITKQMDVLPETTWQHITFTLPDVFWDLFWLNRCLLKDIFKHAAGVLQSFAEKRGIKLGIFMALHTFGKDLKRNVHLHVSVTCGGLTKDGSKWKSLYFPQKVLWKRWRKAIIDWLSVASQHPDFAVPVKLVDRADAPETLEEALQEYADRYWHVYCQKPCKNHKRNVKYLGSYLKRPPIAESKLRHYDGKDIAFRFINRATNEYETKILTVEEFITKLLDHIPDKGFRMIRYFGFLANSVRGKMLPIVRQLLNLPEPTTHNPLPWYLLQDTTFGLNPLECILCGAPMRLANMRFLYTATELEGFHEELALNKRIAS